MSSRVLGALAALLLWSSVVAVPVDLDSASSIVDARVEKLAAGDLGERIDSLRDAGGPPRWVSWIVPAVDERHTVCCLDWPGRNPTPAICRLESPNRMTGHTTDRRGSGALRVLLRIDGTRVDEVRVYSAECTVDAGGLRFYELTDVDPPRSVQLLGELIADGRRDDLADEALMAIALHAGRAADAALERFTAPGAPRELREKTAFWLGSARGERGLAHLRRMLREERSGGVVEQVVFGISVSEADGALDLLMATARDDARPPARSRALFWLAQKAGERAAAMLRDAADEDPDAEVREQAVFGLSQLPPDRGVPLLLGVARTSRHPEVRRAAMFWLGQSGDSRALELFEEILADSR